MELNEVISKTLNRFSFKLYKHLAQGEDGNFFISPFSISTALSMCYAGARGETASQLKSLLSVSEYSDEQIMSLKQNYITSLKNLNGEIALNTANKIYPMIKYPVKPEFTQLLQKNFMSEVQELNFCNSDESAKVINDWVSEKTKEKVKDLIDPKILNEDTRMVLVNAIYFKGNWLNKFKSEETYKDDFYLADGTTKKVDMMKLLNKKFLFKMNPAGLKALSCEFPYVGQSVAMTIILPHQGIKLSEFENELNEEVLKEVLCPNVMQGKVHAYIPKFKVEYKTELSDSLQKLGANLPFDELKADFSGISDDPRGLYISKVVHQAVVEVNEEGTEAAAATGVVMMTRMCMMDFPPEEFKCNRPFLFVIHDKQNGGILFMGKYTKPV